MIKFFLSNIYKDFIDTERYLLSFTSYL